jgi:hypothetical protein
MGECEKRVFRTLLLVVSFAAVTGYAYQEANEGEERTRAHYYCKWLKEVRIPKSLLRTPSDPTS